MHPNKEGWDSLESEFGLDIELEQATDIHHLGSKIYVIRISCLCDDSPTTFTAKGQVKNFFDTKEAKSN
jgi:hypothetical protein